ncbi:DUF2800 domain-containing protein [Propionivibrio dicarboxylicus]|uniref:DUF2800 domain-containing protein n=1 Tax=Propionivibrio dicarboxylicus TaxID=83767 RepID=A0A1G8C9L1_9RHOO|nr:DUF2800 domain-containing protein [Propionivibrio dicarboxylicus]SDH41963.1 Protein of unknown function [Propionivibrio dicarboxylicus]
MASSKYADEGSIAHALAAMCLTEGQDAAAYIGRLIESEDYEHAKLSPSGAKKWMACAGSHRLEQEAEGEFEPRWFSMEVTESMAEHVQVYVDAVRQRMKEYELAGAVEVVLLVEQRLPIEHITGEEGATGTGDAVIIAVWADGTALVDVGDLKFGMGVEVSAVENPQLQIYGSGAVQEYGLLYDITRLRLTIYQPRIKREPSEWDITVEDLQKFEVKAKQAAFHAIQVVRVEHEGAVIHHLKAGDHCSQGFCKARATCPKLAQFVQEGVGADFEVLGAKDTDVMDFLAPSHQEEEVLSAKMQAVDLIEDWCRAVRAEVERRLLAGTSVPGYKLVQGKRGARAWINADEVETVFKSMRLKQEEMYDFKLISPTSAEKVLKDSPKRWNRVLPLITQKEGKPSVAPESDKRPALVIKPVEEDFDVIGDDLAG